jgi:ketosteroid isomerase-like protein
MRNLRRHGVLRPLARRTPRRDTAGVSSPNVARVLEGYAVFNGGVKEPQLAYWHEDGEYHVAREDPDSTVHRGIDALRSHFANWVEAYPDLRIEPLETEEGDKVFVWVRFSGHGGASGAPMEAELAHVVTLRDGKFARLEEYTDRAEARRAAGLEE